jgi:NAD(P)-dependent dehydrogenase (short-subunit alcohol dehydrogenase family)
MGDKLKDKSAVITGSGQGIGRAVAFAMAREGAKVITNSRQAGTPGGDAALTAKEINNLGGKAVPFFGDVSKVEDAESLIKTALDNFGRLDILVNSAGIIRTKVIWNLSDDDWNSVIDIHLKGAFNCSRRAAALMRGQNYGRIINLTAPAMIGAFGQANYAAAKGGIISFTKTLALELGKYGVTANAVSPLAATRMTSSDEMKAGAKKGWETGAITKEFYDALMNMPGPEYVAPLFVYLASDKAANINGQVFFASKGKVAIYSEWVEKSTIYKHEADGMWTVDDLEKHVPESLLIGYMNKAPAQPPK